MRDKDTEMLEECFDEMFSKKSPSRFEKDIDTILENYFQPGSSSDDEDEDEEDSEDEEDTEETDDDSEEEYEDDDDDSADGIFGLSISSDEECDDEDMDFDGEGDDGDDGTNDLLNDIMDLAQKIVDFKSKYE